MTFLERALQLHPEWGEHEREALVAVMCPSDLGLERAEECAAMEQPLADAAEVCRRCWNREEGSA